METQVSPMNSAIKWGSILGLISVAITVINYLTGNLTPETMDSPMTKMMQYGMYAIIILVLVLALQQHRDKELGGYMKYSRGLGLGTLIGVFYGLISAICMFVVFQFLMSADFMDRAIEAAREKMLERSPEMSEDQMEMGLSWARKFMSPGAMAAMGFIGGVFICFIFSLIISAFVKKNNPNEPI